MKDTSAYIVLPLTRKEFDIELEKATAGCSTGSAWTRDRIVKFLAEYGVTLLPD